MSRLLSAALVIMSAVAVSGLFHVNASVPQASQSPVVAQGQQPCDKAPGPYKVAFAGVQNGNCNSCGIFSNQIVMLKPFPTDQKFQAFLSVPGSLIPNTLKVRFAWCLVQNNKWGVDVTNLAQFVGTGEVVQYAGGDASWDCATAIILNRVGPVDGMCKNWPASITVTP